MPRALKVTAAAVAIVAAAISIFIAVFDWNVLRGYIGEKVSERTGREFSINGNLDVKLGLTPRIHAEKIHFANAKWSTEPAMLDIEVVEFRIDLLGLFRRVVRFPEIALSNAKIVLERNREGDGNWVIGAEKGEAPPAIGRLSISEGSTIVFRDPTQQVDFTARFSTDTAAADPSQAVRFDANGKWKGMAVSAKGSGGSLFDLQADYSPYPVRAELRIGTTLATLNGTITGLSQFTAADFAFTLAGEDLAHLYKIANVALPNTPPYRLKGRLTHEGRQWQFRNFSGKVGDSDLSGHFIFDTAGERPKIRAELASKLLDLDDLGPLIGAPPKTGAGETASAEQKMEAARLEQKGKALPDREFSLEKLRAADADIKLNAKNIQRAKALPIEDVTAHVLLEDGVLRIKPLNLGVAGGDIVATIVLDGSANPIRTKADVRFQKLRLNELSPTVELMKTGIGTIGGRANLAASGNSVAKMMASADGDLALAAAGGQISNLLLEFAGLDGGEIVLFLLGGDRQAVLRCAVADFKVTKGLMNTRTLVLDTSDTNIQGSGTVNLATEQLDLTLRPLPKDRSILSFRSPIHIRGTFRDMDVKPAMGRVAARGGAAVMLGLLNPLLALIPLVETGPGSDADCTALVAAAKGAAPKQQGGQKKR